MKKSMNETVVYDDYIDEININDMMNLGRKLYPNSKDGCNASPIVGIVDGHLADFTHIAFAKHEGHPDPGTFFLHDGTKASLDALAEQIEVGGFDELEESVASSPYASAQLFNKLPPFAKKILQLDGGFDMYDVLYNDEKQCDYLKDRAKAFGVVLNDGKDLEVDAKYESCSGKIGACLKYLRNYNGADDGFIAGQAMYINDMNAFTDEDFTLFCDWINSWLKDFIEGIKLNDSLKNRYISK